MIKRYKKLWKLWSVKFAAVMASLVGFFILYPQYAQDLLALVPEQLRPLAAVAGAYIAFTIPTELRGAKQKKLEE